MSKDYIPKQMDEKFIPAASYLLFMEPYSSMSGNAFKLYIYLRALLKASYTHEREAHDGQFVKDGKICVYLSADQIQKVCKVKSRSSAIKVKKELIELGLIEDHRQGLNQANYVFVKTADDLPEEFLIKNENKNESGSSKNEQPDVQNMDIHESGSSKNEQPDVQNMDTIYIISRYLDDDDIYPSHIKDLLKKYLLVDGFTSNAKNAHFVKKRVVTLITKIENSKLNAEGLKKKLEYLSNQEVKTDTLNFWIKSFDNMNEAEVKQLNGEIKPKKKSKRTKTTNGPTESVDWDNYHPKGENDTPSMSLAEIKAVFKEYGRGDD